MPFRNPTDGWARSDAVRASTFASHLKNVFQPSPATSAFTLPTLPYEPQLQHEPIEFCPNEIVNIIKNQRSPKSFHIAPFVLSPSFLMPSQNFATFL